ncbi:RTA1 like protein-domain-containing protein [Aspergillus pseudocaelatus]|uniref:RTA1 like protein-domain-containing protein n=1 Tax=Aspergillus pseudocaelatus TaxID=1825620 RepID=A0ABQ6X4Y8_9EURO|nr:RTA1 like protein-domain-containing protein [Aspergillus pseudocaelatus]
MDFTFHEGVNGSAPWVEFYPYNPSQTAGYAFMAIFGITTVVHIILMFPYKAAYFIPLILGGICETFGYYGRAWSHNNRTLISSWALQQMLILCAPPFVAATIYMVLGRIIRAFDAEHLSPMRTKRITVLFVLNDIICFLTQLGGAGVQITGDAKVMDIGRKVVLVGLVFALVVFLVFVWIAWVFHRRLAAEPTRVAAENPDLGWKRYMWAIYVSCLFLMVRNLVRLVEFGAVKSALNQQEAYIYVFDAAMMFLSMAVLVFWHPGLLIKKARRAGEAGRLCAGMEEGESGDGVPLAGYKGYQRC